MFLIQILLPVYQPDKTPFAASYFSVISKELADKFGGITAYLRSPAIGLWKEQEDKTVKDDIVIFELMAEDVNKEWWFNYRKSLEDLFKQDLIVIRYWEMNTI